MEELKKIFYDPKQGLVNVKKLYDKIKEKDINISLKDVKQFYENQTVNQIMRPIKKPKQFNSFRANYPREIYQMDIIVYNRYRYHNYQYILVVIDIYSRYMEARPMTNRNFNTIMDNFKSIVDSMGLPEMIQCDNEFNTNEFINYLKKNDISVRFSDPDEINKNPIVERVNGTIARQLQKIRLTTNKYDWYNYLSDVVENYNNTIHSTVKNKPIDIFNGKAKNRQVYNYEPIQFNKGDKVRIVKHKKIFDKGDEITHSTQVYMVQDIKGNKIQLDNGELYKPYEIKKVGDIIESQPINEPIKETPKIRIENDMKRNNIKNDNIIEGKRNRVMSLNAVESMQRYFL